MRIISVEARAWTLPLAAPFATAQRTAYEASNVRVVVRAGDGATVGDGACAPVAYVTGEDVSSVLTALGAAGAAFEGMAVDRLQPLLAKADALLAEAPSARAGLEMALFDAWGKRRGLPLWHFFGAARDSVVTDVTIPIVPAAEAGALAAARVREGFRNLKIKVGDAQGHEADVARVAEIARAAPGARLRVDANQGFAPDTAVAFARALERTGAAIDLLEQPVPKADIAGLRYVRERVSVPVFADEAAQSPASVLRLIRAEAVDGVNVKLMKSGLAGAMQIVALCRAAGLRLMLGCMLESGLGTAAAAQMAAGTGAFDFLDLDSHRLLAPQPGVSGGYAAEGDRLRVETAVERPGWGVSLPEF